MILLFLLSILIGGLVGFGTYLAYLSHKDSQFYKKKGVYYLGNGTFGILYLIYKKLSIPDSILQNYEKVKTSNTKIGVTKESTAPNFFLIDIDLIKQILVKDFDHFVDRRDFGSVKGDPLLKKMLIGATGEYWKNLRSKMSPTFTTGKIRRMFQILDESGKKMVKYIKQDMQDSSSSSTVLDLQDGYSKFTMDVVASIAFGIDSKAYDQKGPSIFEQMGSKLQFQFNFLALIKFLIMTTSKSLTDFLGISIMAKDAQIFFSKVIKDAIKQRLQSKEKRNDFLQLMLEVRDGRLQIDEGEFEEFEKEAIIKGHEETSSKVVLDDDDIVAQSVLFILGGYDTTLALHLFAAYNLALFPDIQEKVFQEVEKVMDSNDGELSYDSLNQLEYMDMFINETLRLYPPGVMGERLCTKDFKVPNSDIVISKGSLVSIPIYALHRDEKYFPEPERFDPERFSSENRTKFPQYAFLPFGHGPRNCIGMRLALAEVKVAIAHLVYNFILEPSEKTPIPIEYANAGALKPAGGLWLKMQARK